MKDIRNSEIADILPHTVKTSAKRALSYALSCAFKNVYDSLLKVRIWQNLDNADTSLLDLIAAEVSCPFYQLAENDEEKCRLIKAAYGYNRKIGTVGAVQKLVEAAFGIGKVQEWYEYGGEEFFFKIMLGEGEKVFTSEMYDLFALYIDKIKNKRAKLEALYIDTEISENLYCNMAIDTQYKSTTIYPETAERVSAIRNCIYGGRTSAVTVSFVIKSAVEDEELKER